jgi:hypothetical protein
MEENLSMKQIETLLAQNKKSPQELACRDSFILNLIDSDYFVVSTNIATRLKSRSSEI